MKTFTKQTLGLFLGGRQPLGAHAAHALLDPLPPRLHVTQPPLSRAIKQLETDLGSVLLNRSPSGVALTPAGESLYSEARTLLAQADQVRARVAVWAAADPSPLIRSFTQIAAGSLPEA